MKTFLALVASFVAFNMLSSTVRADSPNTHYRPSRMVSVWLPYWMNMNGTGVGWRAVKAHAQDLDEVSFFSWSVDPASGALKAPQRGVEPHCLVDQVAWLHTHDVAALFTVTLFDKVHTTLNNPAVLSRVTSAIVETAQVNHFDGVDIDFEECTAQGAHDSSRFTSFLEGVATAMHEQTDSNGYPKVAIATILAKTQRGKPSFTNEEAIARSDVDRIRVMAYDYNSKGSNIAGACAPLSWTKSVASYIAGLDCPHDKFILGMPGYGYRWPIKSASDPRTTGKGSLVTYSTAKALMQSARASVSWNDKGQTPAITYKEPGSRKIWLGYYENARSWAAKLDKALLPSPLGGICEWAVGFEDPAAWSMVEQHLATPQPVYGAIGQCYTRYGGGQVFGAPLSPPVGIGLSDDCIERVEQQFEHGRISYRCGDRNAHWVKE